MRHLRAGELGADLGKELLEPVRALRDERPQGADRDRCARPVGQDLGRPLVGQMLIVRAVPIGAAARATLGWAESCA